MASHGSANDSIDELLNSSTDDSIEELLKSDTESEASDDQSEFDPGEPNNLVQDPPTQPQDTEHNNTDTPVTDSEDEDEEE